MKYLVAILALMLSISSADARKRQHYQHRSAPIQQNFGFDQSNPMVTFQGVDKQHTFGEYTRRNTNSSLRQHSNVQMLAHPTGCPRRAFCGCGAAIEKFGTPRRDLWTARAWFAFPKVGVASASSGDAMVRSHHVAILRSHVSGTLWLVADHNSGGGKSRLHVRDISGWTIVRPG